MELLMDHEPRAEAGEPTPCNQSELIKALESTDPDYAFVEQTEKTETGLDVLIKTNSGKWLAWAYDTDTAQQIARLMNSRL